MCVCVHVVVCLPVMIIMWILILVGEASRFKCKLRM